MGSKGYCAFAHIDHDVQYGRYLWEKARKPPGLLRDSSRFGDI